MRLAFHFFIILFIFSIVEVESIPWKHGSSNSKLKKHKKYNRFKHLDHNQRWTKSDNSNNYNHPSTQIKSSQSDHPKPKPKPKSKTQTQTQTQSEPQNNHPSVKSGTATWFTQDSQGSCGWWKSDNDFIVALPQCINADQYCGKRIQVTYKGKSITVEAVDTCPECDKFHLDLSTSAFSALTGDLNLGLVNIQWHFID